MHGYSALERQSWRWREVVNVRKALEIEKWDMGESVNDVLVWIDMNRRIVVWSDMNRMLV